MKRSIEGLAHENARVGVYVCHCGTNISGTVNVEAVTQFAASLPAVVVSRHYSYMCSDPGQALIADDIRNEGLNRVVVASCTPNMHEATFRRACAEAGLNPFQFQMTNIREHCSWVTDDPHRGDRKSRGIGGSRCPARRLAGPTGDAPGGSKTVRAGGRRRDRGDRSGAPPGRFGQTRLPGRA